MALEVVIPPYLLPESPETVTLVDDQTSVFSPQYGRGFTQRNSFADPRWRLKRTYKGMRSYDVAKLLMPIDGMRGGYGIVRATPSWKQRGSMPTTEIITNNDFSNGTSNWAAIAGQSSLSVNDRVLRVTRVGNNASASGYAYQNPSSMLPYTPYIWRFAVSQIQGGAKPYASVSEPNVFAGVIGASTTRGTILTESGLTTGYGVTGAVAPNGGNTYLDNNADFGALVGGYYDVSWATLSQCLLADGPDNYFTVNDALTGGGWTRANAGVTSGEVGPYGNVDAFALTPTTATTTDHSISQVVGTATTGSPVVVLTIDLKGNGYNYVRVQINENTGGSPVYQLFNITTGAGAVGATGSAGANWTDAHTSIVDLGNGWWRCTLIARNTNGATAYSGYAIVHNGDNANSWTPNGTSGVRIYRPTINIGALPSKTNVNSTATAVSGQVAGATGARQISIKSAQISKSGLLLPGDWIELNSELKRVTSPLNTDASGCGILSFSPGLWSSVLSNAPIITCNPMGRFMINGGVSVDAMYGGYVTSELTLDEVFG